jgi:hypothetical protein
VRHKIENDFSRIENAAQENDSQEPIHRRLGRLDVLGMGIWRMGSKARTVEPSISEMPMAIEGKFVTDASVQACGVTRPSFKYRYERTKIQPCEEKLNKALN